MAQPTPKPKWTSDGEIEDVEIEIVKDRQITLPKASRNFEKIPPRPSEPITPPIQYDFQSFNFQAPLVTPVLKPLKLKQQSESNVFGGFVRAGYGNYASPLLEAYINSRKDKNKLVGAHFYHKSSDKGPVDGKNSGSGNTSLSLYGKSFQDNVALSGSLDVDNRTTHFYGYPKGTEVNKSDIKQSYSLFKLSGDLSNTKNTLFGYKLGAAFSYLADKYDAREAEVDLDFNSSYKISDDARIRLKAGYYIISRKDSAVEAKPRNLFVLAPSYEFKTLSDFTINVGLNAAYENDSIDDKGLHLYPNVNISYPINPSLDFVAAFGGNIEKVSLQSLSYQNIWLAPNVPIFHTNKYYELSFGVNARLGNKIGATGGLSFASFRNMYFFVNSKEDQSKFDVAYNKNYTQRTNLYGTLNYAQSETAKFMLRADYFLYATDGFPEAWHKPKYRLQADASFNVYQKLLFTINFIGQGGMKALDPVTDKTVTLKGALDLNFKTEYLFSESFSAFVQLNNITSNKYPLFLNYPVRGFQALAGITWSF
jgi:hypothetical protein